LPADATLNGQRMDRNLRFTFNGPAPGDDLQVTVFLVTTDEVIDAPNVRVTDAEGREIGHGQPPTEAPPAEPGPVYAIDIPRLHLRTGVVQVDWEPPLFVVGQLRASAHVTQGNSVLVGHVRGAVGYNVFDHLDQLKVGDPVIAMSRGETYEFVVSQTQVLPEEDMSPTQPMDSPRLTLMTCAGDWNPLTLDYSERLWIVAEPVNLATARPRAALPTPAPPVVQIAQRGGLGNTDTDLVSAFGAPVGESATRLAVYRRNGVEHRAQLVDLPSALARRTTLVVEHAPTDATLSMDQAVQHSRGLFPKDAQPRAAGPEGNASFVVERFSSAALANALPPDWFSARHGQPGDFLVVYARRPDGRVTDILVGIGDDPSALLDALSATR
jgi:LPXTG-site transpeptidase (sortase) family protein